MSVPPIYKSNKEWGLTDYYFIDLVLMLASSAKIDLGELVHPYYKHREVNLARARMTINMISSLIKKTAGNLNLEEKKVLREVLEDIQKTYVDKSKEKNKADTVPTTAGQSRPLFPQAPQKTSVKEWIHLVQEEIAKKKLNPPSK